jgi:hypothetical protein
MKKIGIALFLTVALVTPAQAQNMLVSQFLSKADALKKKGPLALLSGDIKVLKAQIQNSAKGLRADEIAAAKAGRQPVTCMPKQIALNSDEILGHFRSIPPAQRNLTVKAAFAGLMQKKYPCPA